MDVSVLRASETFSGNNNFEKVDGFVLNTLQMIRDLRCRYTQKSLPNNEDFFVSETIVSRI